ncbi:MAG: SDR family oxidoreductase [Paenibacillaceae bacterium]|nr:SDR family oxidoreductase [Paenibacillaceae bacterium]
MARFSGQIAIVTGGSGGLGAALCKALVAEGAKVYATAFDRSRAEQKGRTALAAETEIALEYVDIRQTAELQEWIGSVRRREGRIDMLVNAAGVCPLDDWRDVTETMWDEVFAVNAKAVFFACQAVLGGMIERGSGAIVNVGSVAGFNGGLVTTPAYGASKGAVHTLTKWLAAKAAPSGVRVNAVAPGPFRSAMTDAFTPDMRERLSRNTPDGKIGEPEDVVQSILFLVDSAASGHITGTTLDVCGGLYMR